MQGNYGANNRLQPHVKLESEGAHLVLRAPYRRDFIAAVKGLPRAERRYDPARKTWQIAPKHAAQVCALCREHFGVELAPPPVRAPECVRQTLGVRYLGDSQDRGEGQRFAYGWSDDDWRVILPEAVLQAWFDGERDPGGGLNHYARLGLARSASAMEVKSAYRRLARQWHPDVCAEPDAADRFREVRAAYEVLSAETARARYDASLVPPPNPGINVGTGEERRYRPPLRCGLITALVTDGVGQLRVEQILDWQPIVNAAGRVLATRWRAGAKQPTEKWINPRNHG